MVEDLFRLYGSIVQILGTCELWLLALKNGREVEPSRLIEDLEKIVKEAEEIIRLFQEMTFSSTVTIGSIRSDHQAAPAIAE